MIKLNEYRLLILEQDGNWEKYEKQIGYLHKDCLEKYCKLKGLDIYSTINEIIKRTKSIIIYNISDDVIAIYLPDILSDEQLYQLELFNDFSLNNVKIIEATKVNDQQEYFQLEDNIQERFSNGIIQSYYNKSSKNR